MGAIHSSACALLGVSVVASLLHADPALSQRARGRQNPFQQPLATMQYPRSRSFDFQHLKLTLDVDAEKLALAGVVLHTIAPLRDGLTALTLDARDNIKVDRCVVNGTNATFTHKENQLTVTLPGATPYLRGKAFTLEVQYRVPQETSRGGANGRGGFTWIKPRANDPLRRLSFWTQGETNTNSAWVPLYDYPNDMITSETIVTVPEAWAVIGNGYEGRVTHDKTNKRRTYRWTMKQPHASYLLSLVGGEFDIQRAVWRGVPLLYVVPKGMGELIPGSFSDTPDMLSFFSDKLGVKYPWAKYAQNAMFDFPGGMENVSATTLGAFSLTDERSGNRLMSGLNAHELAHQWFGDLVTCKHWGESWLNESFATFFEMLYHEHSKGKEQYDSEREGNLNSYLGESRSYKRPLSTHLYASQDALFDAHAYPKGSLVLHMLRRELGDEDFFRGLGHYLRKNAHQPVDADDLAKGIEAGTGRNVEAFFDQWIYKPGHPVLEAAWKYDSAAQVAVLTIKQTQDTSDGTPIYDTPLTVGLLRAGSGTAIERVTLRLNQKEQEFRIPATRPDALLVDPDNDLLKELKMTWADSELPVIFRFAPNHIQRLAALRSLTRGVLEDSRRQLLLQALQTEPAQSVAAEILNALSKTESDALRPLYREQFQSPQISRRIAALNALVALPILKEDLPLLRQVARSDKEQYVIVQRALRTLAKEDLAGSLEVFQAQARSGSKGSVLASTTVDLLNDSTLEEAAPILLEAARVQKGVSVRRNAVSGLKKKGLGNAAIRNGLVALLKEADAPPSLLTEVIETLQERKEKEAVPALETLANATKDQEIAKAARAAATALQGK